MKLTIDDIADGRAYERERGAFLEHVIALKKRRRVGVGPFVTLLFENRDTVRFQVQEMARAERIISDEGIQAELDAYNPLIPDPGALCATMFLELTTDADLRTWLPRLVGIERATELQLAGGMVVPGLPDDAHDAHLTRETTTASVHYLRFELDPTQIEAFAAGPPTLAITHPSYRHATELPEPARVELLGDLGHG